MPGSTPNTGNFYGWATGYAVTQSFSYSSSQNYLTAVGAYTNSASPYGEFDMGDDVLQWNDALLISGSYRGLRGGSWLGSSGDMASSKQFYDYPIDQQNNIGFRVASVPEPNTAVLAALGLAGLIAWGRRRRRR